ncbi:MAG: cell division protein PerM [Marmoricola sp.]
MATGVRYPGRAKMVTMTTPTTEIPRLIDPGPKEPSDLRRLVAAAALGALVSVAVTLVVCMAVAVIGWFLADAGAHGQTTDALRIGADGWLMGLGSHVVAGGTPLGIIPLALTALIAVGGFRGGRWAGRSAPVPAEDRMLVVAALAAGVTYLAAAVVLVLLVGRADAQPGMLRAAVGGFVLGTLAVGAGLGTGTGRVPERWNALPGSVRSMLGGALGAVMLVIAAGACLVTVSLLVSFNEAGRLFSVLGLDAGDALMLCVVTALFAPNAALFGVAYLAGPGFAVGTGTTVSVGTVALGPLPAFPLAAALPAAGPVSGWHVALVAVPPLCAAVAAGLAQRGSGVLAWDSAALRAFAVGVLGAIVVVALVALAGGTLGTGRMTDIGAPMGQVLVTTVGGMAIGGLVGGLLTAWWQRRRARQ